jgi:hypothetical protein
MVCGAVGDVGLGSSSVKAGEEEGDEVELVRGSLELEWQC